MSDNDDNGSDAASVGLAHSRSRREKPKKVTNRLAALAALRATRDSGKKHLAEVDDFKVRSWPWPFSPLLATRQVTLIGSVQSFLKFPSH